MRLLIKWGQKSWQKIVITDCAIGDHERMKEFSKPVFMIYHTEWPAEKKGSSNWTCFDWESPNIVYEYIWQIWAVIANVSGVLFFFLLNTFFLFSRTELFVRVACCFIVEGLECNMNWVRHEHGQLSQLIGLCPQQNTVSQWSLRPDWSTFLLCATSCVRRHKCSYLKMIYPFE